MQLLQLCLRHNERNRIRVTLFAVSSVTPKKGADCPKQTRRSLVRHRVDLRLAERLLDLVGSPVAVICGQQRQGHAPSYISQERSSTEVAHSWHLTFFGYFTDPSLWTLAIRCS